MIVHPRPGSRHVVGPSVVIILVSSTHSSHTCEESWILTKPPAGMFWCRNQFFSTTSGASCSRRRPGFDWCCFYYFVRNSLVTFLEAPCAQIFSLDSWISVLFWHFFCVCKVSNKAFLPPLSTRLQCLVVAIPLVCWLYMCACVCVPLYVYLTMCR